MYDYLSSEALQFSKQSLFWYHQIKIADPPFEFDDMNLWGP